jgi:hypothetical protein
MELGYSGAFRREVACQAGVDQYADIQPDPDRPNTKHDVQHFSIHEKSQARLEMRRLQAPGVDVKSVNVTQWVGQMFESGVASGKRVVEGSAIVVAASEAVLVFL